MKTSAEVDAKPNHKAIVNILNLRKCSSSSGFTEGLKLKYVLNYVHIVAIPILVPHQNSPRHCHTVIFYFSENIISIFAYFTNFICVS